MAEEYCGGANWWDSTSTNRSSRFDGCSSGGGGGGSSSTSSTTTLANSGGSGYGWLTEASVDINVARSSLDSIPPATTSMDLVSLGLSSQVIDWNQQPLIRNPENSKADNSFRSMLQEGMGLNTNFQQDTCSGGAMFGRGFSLDQTQTFSPSCSSMESTVTGQGPQGLTASSFQLDSNSSSSVYGSPSSILQGFIGSSDHNQQHQSIPMNYQQSYFGIGVSNEQQSQLGSPNWAKVPQFLRASPPKHIQQQQQQQQLHFTNNAPYWNASAHAVSMADIRPTFFSSLQNQLPMPPFDEKPKGLQNTLEVRETSSTVKKSGGTESNSNKRGRNEGANSSTLPPFKVRKEKMGDRITALQQLVSPFGKTDTASVLSEAIEYIKFLHEQVNALSTPYLKSGASYQQHQPSNDKVKTDPDGPKQDLRSRGLCLVPVSSTFPMTHETTVDFWTPTFGGTFR